MMMLSYARDSEPLKLIKNAIDISANGEVFHHKMMLFTQMNGFNGHKRLNRVKSKEDREHYIELENYVIDMFGEVLEPTWDYEVTMPKDLKEYLQKYLAWELGVYKEVTEIANKLVVLGYNCESSLVSSCLPGVRKEIEKVRRWLTEFELVNYDMSYILIKDKELHDKIKETE